MSGQRQSRPLGYAIRIGGIVAAIAAFIFVQEVAPRNDDLGKATLVGGALMAWFAWRFGGRHLQPLGEEVLETNPRPPVLYLRSFVNESMVLHEEEGFADMFNPVGPFVAIGQPGERLPPLGAARLYVEDKDWKSRVLELLNRAKLVLIYGGSTPGLGWELEQVRARLHPSRVVVMIPNDPPAWEQFRNRAYHAAGLVLPPMPTGASVKFASAGVAGFLSFDDAWNAQFTPLPKLSSRTTGGGSQTAAQSAMALAEIYGRLGLKVDIPERSWFVIYFRILRAYAFLGVAILVLGGGAAFLLWAQGSLGFDDQTGPFWIDKPTWWPG